MSLLFSIIVPIYNVESYLRECLDSIRLASDRLLNSGFRADVEIICVDDGSTDESGRIADEYAAKDGRIRVLRQENEGLSSARNAGLSVARGDYVTFIDSDDLIDDEWLIAACRLIQKTGAEVVRQGFTLFDDGEKIPHSDDDDTLRSYEGDEVGKWAWHELIRGGWVCILFIKREMVLGRFSVGVQIIEDVLFDLDVVAKCKSACQGGGRGYYYRLRKTSICHKERTIRDTEIVLRELLERCEKADQRLIDRVQLTRAIFPIFTTWLAQGIKSERNQDGELKRLLRKAIDKKLFLPESLALKWRFCFWLFKVSGSFTPCYVLHPALEVYWAIKNKLVARNYARSR